MVADAIRLMLFPALMAFAASSDLLTMTISNRVSLILVGRLLRARARERHELDATCCSHVGAGAVVLVVAFGFFARGWIGGGDAKLAAATALWLGFDHLLAYLVYASLFGGVLTLALIQFRMCRCRRCWPARNGSKRLHQQGRRRALRHRARGGGARRLSGHALDEVARHVATSPALASAPSQHARAPRARAPIPSSSTTID